MKKLSILAIAIACSTTAFANDNFTGFGVGAEADFTSYNVGTNDDRTTGANIVGSYAFAHHNFLVSGFDAKIAVTTPTMGGTTVTAFNTAVPVTFEQKNAASINYRLGYTGFHDQVLPFVKTSYEYIKVQADGSTTTNGATVTVSGKEDFHGYGFGVGVKYMPFNHVELGAEYTRKKYDSNDFGMSSDFDVNSFAIGGAYRF